MHDVGLDSYLVQGYIVVARQSICSIAFSPLKGPSTSRKQRNRAAEGIETTYIFRGYTSSTFLSFCQLLRLDIHPKPGPS